MKLRSVVSRLRNEEDWHPPYQLMCLGPQDEDLKTWRSHDDVPPTDGLRGVELGSRQRRLDRLPEHSEDSGGETHQTKGPRAGSDGAEAKEPWGKDGKTS